MKSFLLDFKKGLVKLQVETLDDLWYLSQIVETGDEVRGKAYRKIKRGGDGEKGSTDKIPITLSITIEKVDFSEQSLKLNGTVLTPTEDIPKGSYQSITLTEGSELSLQKKWLGYQREKLEESLAKKGARILIVAMDREQALFAVTKKQRFEIVNKIEGDVGKKDERVVSKGNFYNDVEKLIEQYRIRYGVDHIIIASPAFWKDEFMKKVNAELKKKITLTTCFSVSENAISEILRRDEVKNILKDEKATQELKLVDVLFKEISIEGNFAYGFHEVKHYADQRAVETLLLTDTIIKEYREKETFQTIEEVMKTVDKNGGKIVIISDDNEAGKKLNGLAGIGALLRYK